MPLTDERLKEKIPFDVYAMMLILAFAATGGSIWLLNDHLQKEWYAGEGPNIAHAEHLTAHNSLLEDREKYFEWLTDSKNKDLIFEVEVTPTDLEDYKRAWTTLYDEDDRAPELVPYPAYIKPLTGGINLKPGMDTVEGVPPEDLQKLMDEYKDGSDDAAGAAADAEPDNAEKRGAEPGDAEAKPAEPGDAEAKPAEPGDAEAKPAEPGDAEAMPAEPGDAEAKPAEPGDAEAKPAEPGDAEKKADE